MKKNKIIGPIVALAGCIIVSLAAYTVYSVNAIAIWVAEALGATPTAGAGIQTVFVLIAIALLFSIFLFGILSIYLGLSYLFGVTPFDILKKIRTLIFGKSPFDQNRGNF